MTTPNNHEESATSQPKLKVPVIGYFALLFAITFFSGIFAAQKGWVQVFDFNAINGSFGTMKEPAKATFAGMAGTGARDGFLFALGLVPSVMLALGVIEVVDHLGGLKAAQRLLTPILRPILGIPGICGLALVASFQSMDACAGMVRSLRDTASISEREKTIFCAFAFSVGGLITNYFAIVIGIFSFMTVPIGLPLLVIVVFKILGANAMRMYLKYAMKGE